MPKFNFRLERVLEYRRLVETWAKDAFLEARAAHLQAQDDLGRIRARQTDLLGTPITRVDEHQALEQLLTYLDEEAAQQQTVINLLAQEEENRRMEWLEARQDLEALEKLRERAYAEWTQEESRREQNALDEWAVLRRESA